MSEKEEVVVLYMSEEMRRSSLHLSESDQKLIDLPAASRESGHVAHGHSHRLNLGLRRSFASTDLLHNPHPGSSRSSFSLESLKGATQPRPDCSSRQHQLELYSDSSSSSNSSQGSLEDVVPTTGEKGTEETKMLLEAAELEKWNDAVDDMGEVLPKDEDSESFQSIEEEEGEEADTMPKKESQRTQLVEALSTGMMQPETTSSYQPQTTPHTSCHTTSRSLPPLLPDQTQASQLSQPASSRGRRHHYHCLAHRNIARCPSETCLTQATQTSHCNCHQVPGPYANMPSCAQLRKTLAAVITPLRAEVEMLWLTQEDNRQAYQEILGSLHNLQNEMRALVSQWQRDREESQGGRFISTQLESLQYQMTSITQLTRQTISDFCKVGRQLEELRAVCTQSPSSSSSGK